MYDCDMHPSSTNVLKDMGEMFYEKFCKHEGEGHPTVARRCAATMARAIIAACRPWSFYQTPMTCDRYVPSSQIRHASREPIDTFSSLSVVYTLLF